MITPTEDAVTPLPMPDSTPPVTKMYLVGCAFGGGADDGAAAARRVMAWARGARCNRRLLAGAA